jgi:hypothetical protein
MTQFQRNFKNYEKFMFFKCQEISNLLLKIKNSCFLNVKKSAIFSLKIEYVFPSNF